MKSETFLLIFIYLFIWFWLHWVFVAVQGLSLTVVSRSYSLLWCWTSYLHWLLLLWGNRLQGLRVSVVAAHGLRCPTACAVFQDQGSKPSPALTGKFLTTFDHREVWDIQFFKFWNCDGVPLDSRWYVEIGEH